MKSTFLSLSAGLLLAGTLGVAQTSRIAKPNVIVYKSATCGCCSNWVEHMKANGFNVTVTDVADIEVPKRAHGVPKSLESCHTAIIGGYVVEGHVPRRVVTDTLPQDPAFDRKALVDREVAGTDLLEHGFEVAGLGL